MIVLDHEVRHVHLPVTDRHLVGFVPTGSEDRSAGGQDAGKSGSIEAYGAVLHETAETVPEADHGHAVGSMGGLTDPADGRVQTGRVSAGGEDAYVPIHGASNSSDRGLSFIGGRGGGLNPSHPDAYHDAL